MKYEQNETVTISLERYDDLKHTEQLYKKIKLKEFKLSSDLQGLMLNLFDKVDEFYEPRDIDNLNNNLTSIGLTVKVINENNNYIVYGAGEVVIDLTTIKRKILNP